MNNCIRTNLFSAFDCIWLLERLPQVSAQREHTIIVSCMVVTLDGRVVTNVYEELTRQPVSAMEDLTTTSTKRRCGWRKRPLLCQYNQCGCAALYYAILTVSDS